MDDKFKKNLDPNQYKILVEKGTEPPFSGDLLYNQKNGEYHCAACGSLLFTSDSKYESNTPGLAGWPSFSKIADNKAVRLLDDNSLGMHRTEVLCAKCGGHLGHLFDDAESPSGEHYCINSASLEFKAEVK